MNKFLSGIASVALISVAGCATEDLRYAAAKKVRAAENGEPQLVTGTKLVKPTTERVVKGVGNNEYNETNTQHTSIGNNAAFRK